MGGSNGKTVPASARSSKPRKSVRKIPGALSGVDMMKYVRGPSGTITGTDLLRSYGQRYRDADRLALAECVYFCSRTKRKLPQWAVESLALGFQRYFNKDRRDHVKRLDQALFGANPKGGRHADPLVGEDEKTSQRKVYAAVIFAEREGYSKMRRFLVAADILHHLRETRSLETIQSIYNRRKRADKSTWQMLADPASTPKSMATVPTSEEGWRVMWEIVWLEHARKDGRIKLPERTPARRRSG